MLEWHLNAKRAAARAQPHREAQQKGRLCGQYGVGDVHAIATDSMGRIYAGNDRVRVREGKSKNAYRTIPLTDRAAVMLRSRSLASTAVLVFANRSGQQYLVTSMNHLHRKARTALQLPKDFVIHSLRHTMLTRLGESGADAFAIMRIAGHSSITVSQRYVHPSPEAVERVFERLQLSGQDAQNGPKVQPPATILATVAESASVTH